MPERSSGDWSDSHVYAQNLDFPVLVFPEVLIESLRARSELALQVDQNTSTTAFLFENCESFTSLPSGLLEKIQGLFRLSEAGPRHLRHR